MLQKEKSTIEKKYKVRIKYFLNNKNKFFEIFGSDKIFYAYLPKKIYHYDNVLTLNDIFKNYNGEYLYSSIELKIL